MAGHAEKCGEPTAEGSAESHQEHAREPITHADVFPPTQHPMYDPEKFRPPGGDSEQVDTALEKAPGSAKDENNSQESEEKRFEVKWDGADDPMDPKNMSRGKYVYSLTSAFIASEITIPGVRGPALLIHKLSPYKALFLVNNRLATLTPILMKEVGDCLDCIRWKHLRVSLNNSLEMTWEISRIQGPVPHRCTP